MASETSDMNFKSDVIDSPVPVMVDFWAPWCGPCRIAGPIIDRVSEKASLTGKARVYKLNVDENPQAATQYRVTGIPTVIVFKNGQVDKTLVGVQEEQVYLDALGV
ncbi:MAG: thioredoxin [Chitinispirillaceae bacterium]|jgi:thioredoxin 1